MSKHDPFRDAKGRSLDFLGIVYGIKRDPGDDDIIYRDKIYEFLRMGAFVPTVGKLHSIARWTLRRSVNVRIVGADGVVKITLIHKWWDKKILFWRPAMDMEKLSRALFHIKPASTEYIIELG